MTGPSGLQRALLRLERLDQATARLGATELPFALASDRLAPFAASPLDDGLLADVLDRLAAGAGETLSSPARSPRPRRRLVRPLAPAGAPALPASVVAPREHLRRVARGIGRRGAPTGGPRPPLRPEPERSDVEALPDALVRAAARVAGGSAAIASPVAADWVRGGRRTAEGEAVMSAEAASTSAGAAALAGPGAAGRVPGDRDGGTGEAASSAGEAAAEPIAARDVLRAVLARAVPAGEQPRPDFEPAPPPRRRQTSVPGTRAPRIRSSRGEPGGPGAGAHAGLPERERPDPERHELLGRAPRDDPRRWGAGALEHAVLPVPERGEPEPERHDLDGRPPAHDSRLPGAGGPGALEHVVWPDPERHDPASLPPADEKRPLPAGASGLAELVRRWERGGALPDGEPPGSRDRHSVQRPERRPLELRPPAEPSSQDESDDALASALERLLASELRRHGIDTEAG